jgi:hypothetical protein
MADNPIAAIPGKALPLVKTDQKTREPMTLAQRVKKMLGITTWSELTKGDEPYFGF